MPKSPTPLEKRLAAYAVSAGVALAVAPAADAQVIYTDIEPDVCLNFASHQIDLDGDGVDDFRITQSSIFAPMNPFDNAGFQYYGDIKGLFGDNKCMATSSSPYAQALISGAAISSAQNFDTIIVPPYFYNWALFWFVGQDPSDPGGGNWRGGNDAFVGLKFIADRAGAATTHYGWVRVSATTDGRIVCVHEFAYESTPDAPIEGGAVPVELVAFDAQVDGDHVVLNWETSSETNNAGFEVQMMQGEDWQALGFVEGNGTTTETQTYSYTAEGMDVGIHSFRLKQIDFDGAFEYSPEVEATIEVVGTHQLSNAYPNPFNPQSQFNLAVARDQRVTAELYNVLGQRVATLFNGTIEANSTQIVRIDGSALASGAYIVRIAGETFSDALRVTLAK